MHPYAVQTACDYACMCVWLGTSMLCIQLLTMHARAWAMHNHAMQSACDYACMCMWLCTSMPCSQFGTMHAWACDYACMCMWLCTPMLCNQLVTKSACAYDYAHLSYAVSLWICMHVRVIMHIHAMQPACNYACMSMWLCTFMLCRQLVTMHACAFDYAHLCYAASL